MRSPRIILLLLLLAVSAVASARKPPRWKMKHPQTAAGGLQYEIIKRGKGDSIRSSDRLLVQYCLYDKLTKAVSEDSRNISRHGVQMKLSDNTIMPGFRQSLRYLREGGSGYFSWPAQGSSDTVYCYIRLLKVSADTMRSSLIITPPADSIRLDIKDPGSSDFGDSLIATATLVELPTLLATCDSGSGKPSYTMMKFRIRYFENGVQYRDIYVAVECPNAFGPGYFTPGNRYLITAVKWHAGDTLTRSVMDAYISDTATPRYRGLRLRKA